MENGIKMVLKERKGKGLDWIDLVWDRAEWQAVVYTVMKFWPP